jgi:hypothetical protein
MPDTQTARALIAAEIGGDVELTARDAVVRLRFPSERLVLPHSPVTSVQAVWVGDTELLEGYTVTNFALVRAAGQTWPAGIDITVDYTTGWLEGEEPVKIQAALQMVMRYLATDPASGISQVKMGDNSVTRDTSVLIPPLAKILVAEWVRPQP